MILILSASADVTVRGVCRWLKRWGHECQIIDDDDPIVAVDLRLDDEHRRACFETRSGRRVDVAEVDALWCRRGALTLDASLIGPPGRVAEARLREWPALRDYLEAELEARPRLGSLRAERSFNKLAALGLARELGLAIPATRVSSERDELAAALASWGRGIHKGLHIGAPAEEDPPEAPATTTRALTAEGLARAPERLFPRLSQARVDKRVELRVAYLAGELWALALVPRRPGVEAVDVRVVDLDAHYHLVPYALPVDIQARLRALMTGLGLATGSIDMLVDDRGRHLFLEVNPSGQLDWLREACNAPIERRVAEHLLELAGQGSAARGAREDEGKRALRESLPGRARAAPKPDPEFAEAKYRFARVAGQQVLVRPPSRPILRSFLAPPTPPAADRGSPPATVEAAVPPTEGQAQAIVPANLEIVDGRDGALIYDLQRGRALRPSPALSRLLEDPAASDDAARLALATRAGLIAWVDEPARYPKRSRSWASAKTIQDAIVDVDAGSEHDFASLSQELAELGCEHLLIRVAHARGLELVDAIMATLEDGPAMFVEWWLPWKSALRSQLIERVARWPRITSVVVFAAPAEERGAWLRTRSGVGEILATGEPLDLRAPTLAGPETMVVRDELFREAQTHAAMFHRKLAIGTGGELRNAPHLARSFGRLGERPLAALVEDPRFHELGALHRGRVEGCRACSFRFACTDNRAPVRGADGRLHLPTACAIGPTPDEAPTESASRSCGRSQLGARVRHGGLARELNCRRGAAGG